MSIQNDISDIKLTLKYGYFNGENYKKLLGAHIAFTSICLAGLVLGIVLATIQQINDPDSVGSFIVTLIVSIFAFSFLPIILFILLHRNEKIRKEVEKWIEDAIMADAYIKSIDKRAGVIISLIKFQVDFDIDGIHYTRTSEEEKQILFSFKSTKGYFPYMSSYIDKKVKILYSPKYDQVMILKLK